MTYLCNPEENQEQGIDTQKLFDEAIITAERMFSSKRHKECCVILEQMMRVWPKSHNLMQLAAINYQALNRTDDAERLLLECLDMQPENPESLNNLAICHSRRHHYDKATECLERALRINPDSDVFLNNLSLQMRNNGMPEKAVPLLRRSLGIKEAAQTWAMLGGAYGELKMLGEAERCTRRAIELKPDLAEAHVDLASILQLGNRWAEAFEEYEWRLGVYDQIKFWDRIYDPAFRWEGSDPRGKTIIVHTEQGNGDTIQFLRYLGPLKARGAKVVLHCSESIKPIASQMCDEVFCTDPGKMPEVTGSRRDDVPAYDHTCFMLSLPHLLREHQIPADPYILAPGKADLSAYGGFKVGIAWAGNPEHPNDRKRSCKLKLFQRISEIEGIALFSVMKDYRKRGYHDTKETVDLMEDSQGIKLIDVSSAMSDYSATATLIASLDAIVCVDTSVAHLAAAMGKPTAILLPWNPDWRWGAEGESSVWYPSAFLARQEKPGDWESAFAKAESWLRLKMCRPKDAGVVTEGHDPCSASLGNQRDV